MESIVQDKKECLICHAKGYLHRHHIFGESRRQASDRYGLTVWLCPRHHNMSAEGVHYDRQLDREIKILGQHAFEEYYGHGMFMKIFGKNYITLQPKEKAKGGT